MSSLIASPSLFKVATGKRRGRTLQGQSGNAELGWSAGLRLFSELERRDAPWRRRWRWRWREAKRVWDPKLVGNESCSTRWLWKKDVGKIHGLVLYQVISPKNVPGFIIYHYGRCTKSFWVTLLLGCQVTSSPKSRTVGYCNLSKWPDLVWLNYNGVTGPHPKRIV